ncbi:hypothetical protein ACLEPN_30300, partial [Myxococcus sp. 1LA]
MNRKVSVCAGMMAAVVAFSASAEEAVGEQAAAASVDWQGVAHELSAPPLVAVAEPPVIHVATAGAPSGSASAAPEAGAVKDAAPSSGEVSATTSAAADANEVHIPFSLTLVPGLSTSGFHTGNVVNNVSIGLVSTHAKRVDGVAMSLAGNWVGAGGLSGAQFTVGANFSKGPVTGAQFSVGANVSGADLLGVQSTVGVNVVRGNAEGAQLAVGGNIASGAVNGTQMGVAVNVAGKGLLGGA